jgi:DNA-binding MarR family transcriptional regulator
MIFNMSKPHKQYIRKIKLSELNTKTKKFHQYIKNNIGNKTQTELAKELNICQSTISRLLKKWKKQNYFQSEQGT